MDSEMGSATAGYPVNLQAFNKVTDRTLHKQLEATLQTTVTLCLVCVQWEDDKQRDRHYLCTVLHFIADFIMYM